MNSYPDDNSANASEIDTSAPQESGEVQASQIQSENIESIDPMGMIARFSEPPVTPGSEGPELYSVSGGGEVPIESDSSE